MVISVVFKVVVVPATVRFPSKYVFPFTRRPLKVTESDELTDWPISITPVDSAYSTPVPADIECLASLSVRAVV